MAIPKIKLRKMDSHTHLTLKTHNAHKVPRKGHKKSLYCISPPLNY